MMNPIFVLAGVLGLVCAAALPASGSPVSGRVRVLGRAGRATAATIVFAEALESRAAQRPGHYTLMQRNKSFVPRVLAVPVGSTVDFPNEDLIFHNVFSMSRPSAFDLGLYR